MNATAPTSRIRYAAERQEAIVDAAHTQGRVDVTEISERLGVTPETVRRDLTVLEQRGLVRRVHGGARGPNRPRAKHPAAPQDRGG